MKDLYTVKRGGWPVFDGRVPSEKRWVSKAAAYNAGMIAGATWSKCPVCESIGQYPPRSEWEYGY